MKRGRAGTSWMAGLVAGLLAAAALPCAGAQSSAAWPLRVDQAVQLALQRNARLRLAAADLAQADAGVARAGAAAAPSIELQAGATRSNDPLNVLGMKLSQRNATFSDFGASQFLQALDAGGDPGALAPDNLDHPAAADDFHTAVQAQWPLYTAGRVEGLREQAREQLAAARAGEVEARQRVVQEVVDSFDAVLSAQAFAGVARQAMQAAQGDYDTASSLLRAGVVVRSDVLSARLRLEGAQLSLAQAADAVQQAQDRLRVVLGLPQSQSLQLEGGVDVPMPQGDPQLWTRDAIERNPAIQALRHQLEAAGGGVQVARSQLYPQVGAVASVDTHDADPGFGAHSYTIGAQLRWTLFDGGVARADVDQALADRMRAQARLDAAEEQLAAQIREGWRQALDAQRTRVERELAVQQAQEATRIVQRRYADGVGTLVDLQQSQAQLDRARADLILARHRVQVQRVALRLALGRLDPAVLQVPAASATSPLSPASGACAPMSTRTPQAADDEHALAPCLR